MKLEDLIEFWTMLLYPTSEGRIAVSRDMAERTLTGLKRLDRIRDLITDVSEELEEDLE